MALERHEINRKDRFQKRISWPTRIGLGIVAFWTASYLGSDWMHVRDLITPQLYNDDIVSHEIGHIIDFSMSKSKDRPLTHCATRKDCKQIKRYLFKITGDGVQGHKEMYMVADYNIDTNKLYNRAYCVNQQQVKWKDDKVRVTSCR